MLTVDHYITQFLALLVIFADISFLNVGKLNFATSPGRIA